MSIPKTSVAQQMLQKQQAKLKSVEKKLQGMLGKVNEALNALKVEELQIKCNVVDEEHAAEMSASANTSSFAVNNEAHAMVNEIKMEDFGEYVQSTAQQQYLLEQQQYLLQQQQNMINYEDFMNEPSWANATEMDEIKVNNQLIDLNMPTSMNSINHEFLEEKEE